MRRNPPTEVDHAPEPGEIYQLAERYSEASELLSGQAKANEYGCAGPMLLVDSFAVELYLKCLHVLDNDALPKTRGIDGHDWKILFDGLKSHTKTEIRRTFDRMVQGDPIMRHLAVHNPGAPPLADFDASLSAAAETFAKRRYLYEKRTGEPWFYAHFIRNAIRKVTRLDLRIASIWTPPSDSGR